MGQKNNLLRYTLTIVQFIAIRNERDQELWSYRHCSYICQPFIVSLRDWQGFFQAPHGMC